ncbi:hypothetical protein SMICM17S_10437 [Streptomyces microflavus]
MLLPESSGIPEPEAPTPHDPAHATPGVRQGHADVAELDVVGLLVGRHVVGVVQQFERPRLCLPFYALRSTVSLVRHPGDQLCAVIAVAVARE